MKHTRGASRKRKPTAAELLLPQHLAELDVFVIPEVRVCEERRWRLDFAEKVTQPKRKRLAFEIEGVSYKPEDVPGRHQRGAQYEEDCRKYLEAKVQGFEVFRATPQMVLNGELKDYVRRWLDRNQ